MLFFYCSSRFSVPKWNTNCSQPGLRFQEIFNVRKLFVGWASFFHFGTENGEEQLKNTISTITSTVSLFLLKYWATISVDVSLTKPTPTPTWCEKNQCQSQSGDNWTFLRILWIFIGIYYLSIPWVRSWRMFDGTETQMRWTGDLKKVESGKWYWKGRLQKSETWKLKGNQ